jgi:hypothetical protein
MDGNWHENDVDGCIEDVFEFILEKISLPGGISSLGA